MLSLRGKDAGFEGMRFDNQKFDKGFEGNGDRRGKEVGTEITEYPRGSARGQCLLVDRPGDSASSLVLETSGKISWPRTKSRR